MVAILACTVLLWPQSGAPAGPALEIHKLNGPLVRVLDGSVSEPELSHDGRWAVFLADRDVEDRPELYAARTDGSTPAVKLNGPLGAASIASFQIAPDSARVVYHLEANLDELRSVPIDGARPSVLLNTQPLAQIDRYTLAADSSRAVFLALENLGGFDELFSAPLDGVLPSVKLNPPLPIFGDVLDFAISRDGTRVVYAADQEVSNVRELFVVPAGGGASVKLSGPRVATADVLDLAISPDSTRVAYRADQRVDEFYELFTAAIDGSSAPLALTSPATRALPGYAFAAFGRVVFSDGTFILSAPAGVSGPTTELGFSFDYRLPVPFHLSSDLKYAVFLSPPIGPHGIEMLNSRPVDGSAPVVDLAIGAMSADDFQVGQRYVAFFKDYSLIVTPIHSRTGALVYGNGDLFALDPSEEHLLMRRPDDGSLLSMPVGRPSEVTVLATQVDFDTPLRVSHYPHSYARSSSGGRRLTSGGVLFEKSLPTNPLLDDVTELYHVPIDGSSAPVRLNLPFTRMKPVGQVRGFLTRGPWTVYIADEVEPLVPRLYAQRLDAPGPALELAYAPYTLDYAEIAPTSGRLVDRSSGYLVSAPLDGSPLVLLAGPGVGQFEIDAHETAVAFLQGPTPSGPELDVAPLDGSAPWRRLSAAGVRVFDFRLSPDGSHAAYRADPVAGMKELFSVPLDGSAAPVKLNGTVAPAHEGVRSYQFSSDGLRVVYLAFQDGDGFPELHSALVDGSGEIELASSSLGNGLSGDYLVTTSGFVVFSAEGDTPGVTELYGVPLAGGTAPFKLSGTLVAGGNVGRFAATNDGARVVFAADALLDQRVELFSASVAGGSAPVLLSGVTTASSDPDFALDPRGVRVVFRRFESVARLYSAPIDGSAAPIRLDGSGSFDLVNPNFIVLPDGKRVLFSADGDGDLKSDLFLAGIKGGELVKVSGDMPLNGGVLDFRSGSPGFVYRANQDDVNQIELYHVTFEQRASSADPLYSVPY